MVLKQNVEVRLSLLPKNNVEGTKAPSESSAGNLMQREGSNKVELNIVAGLSDKDKLKRTSNLPVNSVNHSDKLQAAEKPKKLEVLADGRVPSIPVTLAEVKGESTHQCQKAMSDEQRLESVWIQAAENYTPEFIGHSKPEKNQILPQNGTICQDNIQSLIALDAASKSSIDELNHEINCLKVCDAEDNNKEQAGVANQHAVSPSLLHKENQ